MDREWNDSQPIYRQLRDRVVAMILDGVLKQGDPMTHLTPGNFLSSPGLWIGLAIAAAFLAAAVRLRRYREPI